MKQRHSATSKIREEHGDVRLRTFGLFLGILWLVAVTAIHIFYAAQRIPLPFGRSLERFLAELVVGPQFFNFWLKHLLRLMICGLFLVGVQALGRRAGQNLKILSLTRTGSASELAFSMGLGLFGIGYLAFAVLLVPQVSIQLLQIFFACFCIAGAAQAPSIWRFCRNGVVDRTPLDGMERLALIPLACGLFFAFIGTTSPEISYDALVYHLGVPQSYLLDGGITNLPYNHYSYLPLLASMFSVWGLAIGGMYMAKIFNFAIGMALLQAVYAFSSEQAGRKHAIMSCSLAVSIPLILYLFWMVNSEFGAALFVLLSLLSCLEWQKNSANISYLYLVALFGGAAMATKYTTVPGVVLLSLYSMARLSYSSINDRKAMRLGIFVLILALPLLPWWIRNYLFQGNPFFPYATQYFGGSTFDPELLRDWYAETRNASPGLAVTPHIVRMWKDAVLGFESLPFNYLGPLLLGLAPLSLRALGLSGLGCVVVGGFGAYVVGLSVTHISRLLLPYIIVASTGVAYCVTDRTWYRPLLLGIFLIAASHNLYRWSQVFFLTSVSGLRVGLGRETSDNYLSKARNYYPTPSYGAFRHIRALKLPADAKVLIIGDPRTFYSPRQTITNAPHDIPVVFAWANEAKDSDELYKDIVSQRVSIIVSNKPGSLHTDAGKYVNSRNLQMITQLLATYFTKTYEDEWTAVFQAHSAAKSG